jgi:formamidopyrimidine-DNA glycosylase
MPELPEVETVMQGLKPHLENMTIREVIIRRQQLRWPIPLNLSKDLPNQRIQTLVRRAKYLIMHLEQGAMLIHLGMTGSLRIVKQTTPPQKHDHIDLILDNSQQLRYTDPRRFGAWLWTEQDPYQHPLIQSLGVEPLDPCFTSEYLLQHAKNRQVAIKPFIMNSHVVVGIGNIYAAEALFLAGIHPTKPAGQISPQESIRLVDAIKTVLLAAIQQGGTTIKDFINSEGKPGYFTQKLHVYGRAGQPCTVCGTPLQNILLGQRSTVFCEHCQANG